MPCELRRWMWEAQLLASYVISHSAASPMLSSGHLGLDPLNGTRADAGRDSGSEDAFCRSAIIHRLKARAIREIAARSRPGRTCSRGRARPTSHLARHAPQTPRPPPPFLRPAARVSEISTCCSHGTSAEQRVGKSKRGSRKTGADARVRTADLLITKTLLLVETYRSPTWFGKPLSNPLQGNPRLSGASLQTEIDGCARPPTSSIQRNFRSSDSRRAWSTDRAVATRDSRAWACAQGRNREIGVEQWISQRCCRLCGPSTKRRRRRRKERGPAGALWFFRKVGLG
jgi:hypothetical protein